MFKLQADNPLAKRLGQLEMAAINMSRKGMDKMSVKELKRYDAIKREIKTLEQSKSDPQSFSQLLGGQ